MIGNGDVKIICTTMDVPANSFVKVIGYNTTSQCLIVTRPTSDNMSSDQLVFVQELVKQNDVGVGKSGGFVAIKKTSGESISIGDRVGTDENEFTAIKLSDGYFKVGFVSGDYLIINKMVGLMAGMARRAKTQEAGQTNGLLSVKLVDASDAVYGSPFDVTCRLSTGTDATKIIPPIVSGEFIYIGKTSSGWETVQKFTAIDTAKGLEVASSKLAMDVDTDQFQFTSGELQTKIDEC